MTLVAESPESPKPMYFPVALKAFTSPAGEKLSEFREQFARLTSGDKEWFRVELLKAGVNLIS